MINNILFFIILFSFCSAYTKEIKNIDQTENNIINEDNSIKSEKINTAQASNTPEEQTTETDQIELNFENTTLSNVLNYLSERKNVNYIPKKELDAIKVSLITREPLSLESAWDKLLTLLDLHNFTMINVDNLYRIVPKPQGKQEPLPFYSSSKGTEPEDLPESDLTVRYLYFLRNIKAETVKGFLTTMLEGTIETNKDLDACIITEKCLNIKSAMKIIKELDQGGLREAIKIVQLQYANADEIAQLFNEKIIPQNKQAQTIRFLGPQQQKPSTYFSKETKIFPDSRNNSLILLGTNQNLTKIIEFTKKYLDIPLSAAKSRIHIKEIKYARAENLKPIITNIIKPPEGAAKALQVGGYKYFEDVIIEADSTTSDQGSFGGGNRLIISCNQDDWKRLEKLINKLDKPQPQVAFEVMIVDVSIKHDRSLGTQLKPKKDNLLGKGTRIQFINLYEPADQSPDMDLALDIGGAAGGQSAALLSLGQNDAAGKGENLWGIVKSYLSTDNFNIINQPFVVTNNYNECVLKDIDTRYLAGKLDKTVGTETIETREPRDATNEVKLTPRINLEGLVDLQIIIDIQEWIEREGFQPDKQKRDLVTRVSMATGEVLVLGGITRTKISEGVRKTPILGDIPIIGNLFKNKTQNNEKSNIYIFIRPSIIKPRINGDVDEYTLLKLDYAKYQMLNADTYSQEKDPIQRWFFKPDHQTSRQKIADAQNGIYRPIDDYAYGKMQPKSVNIKRDPYYRVEEAIQEEKKEKKRKNKSINTNKKINPKKRSLKRRRK